VHRFHERQVCKRVLLDELLGAKPQTLGSRMNLARFGPLLGRKAGHFLNQGRRRRNDGCDG